MIPLLVALFLGVAWADEIPESMQRVVDAIDKANEGDRKGAVKLLSKVLAAEPDNLDARVARGVSLYVMGDHAKARSDLDAAFSGRTWEHKVITQETLTEISATTTTLDLTEQRKTGAAMRIVLATRDGDLDVARQMVQRSRQVFGDHAQVMAAEARVLLAEGDSAKAFAKLTRALGIPDPTLLVQSVASEMVALEPELAPFEVKDWLKAAGQWTAHYNAAIGKFRERHYGGCVDEVEAGLVAFPKHERMLALGYPCAARSDLPRAEEWMRLLGGPKKVEPWSVLAHARLLQERNRENEALDLLVKVPVRKGSDLAQQVETLQIDILLGARRLDDAVRFCKGHAPVAEVNVAYQLIEKERWDDAETLLENVCPELKGQSTEGNCLQLLEYARSRQ